MEITEQDITNTFSKDFIDTNGKEIVIDINKIIESNIEFEEKINENPLGFYQRCKEYAKEMFDAGVKINWGNVIEQINISEVGKENIGQITKLRGIFAKLNNVI